MAAPQVYFGNLRSAGFVRAPATGLDASSVGALDSATFGGGGAFVSQSPATHREYAMQWSGAQVEEVQFLSDFRAGLYGSGLLYWVDPYASYYNALPPHWAAPFLTANGWPSLMGAGIEATQVAATSTANLQPIYSAQYVISSPASSVPDRALVMLIPPTMQLSIGFSGSATNGGVVRIQPINLNGTLAATQDFTLLSASGTTRMNKTFSGATYRAIKVYLSSTIAGTSTVKLDSGDAIYSLIGASPTLTGNHLPGRGHTGMRFGADSNSLTYTFFDDARTTPARYVSAAAKFIEVGAWV